MKDGAAEREPPWARTEPRLLIGHHALVTGATSGIGEATARELALRGAEVFLAGRTMAKARQAVTRILKAVPSARLVPLGADLTSLEQVRTLARSVLDASPRLDLLVNNAGCLRSARTLTEDGFEETWQVNYLAPFLLTRLLLSRMRAHPPSRVVNVSSEVHRQAHGEWRASLSPSHFSPLHAYAESKLALLLFTVEFARRVPPQLVTANAVHPGVVHTRLGAGESGVVPWFFRKTLDAVGMSPEEGAQTTLFASTSRLLEGLSGKYLAHSRLTSPSEAALDPLLGHQLWELSEKLVGVPAMGLPDEQPSGGIEGPLGGPLPLAVVGKNPVLARANP